MCLQCLRIKLLPKKHRIVISPMDQYTQWSKELYNNGAPGTALPGTAPLQSLPPTLPVSKNMGSGISLPFIIIQVCSVLPQTKVKAIFLEIP